MNTSSPLSHIPIELQEASWLKAIMHLLQQQSERITALEKTVQELKDENARLKKIPTRPKFRSGGGKPGNRNGSPDKNTNGSGADPSNKMMPKKEQQEIRIEALGYRLDPALAQLHHV